MATDRELAQECQTKILTLLEQVEVHQRELSKKFYVSVGLYFSVKIGLALRIDVRQDRTPSLKRINVLRITCFIYMFALAVKMQEENLGTPWFSKKELFDRFKRGVNTWKVEQQLIITVWNELVKFGLVAKCGSDLWECKDTTLLTERNVGGFV